MSSTKATQIVKDSFVALHCNKHTIVTSNTKHSIDKNRPFNHPKLTNIENNLHIKIANVNSKTNSIFKDFRISTINWRSEINKRILQDV